MNETVKTLTGTATVYDQAYWDNARRERIAQERKDAETSRVVLDSLERAAIQAEVERRVKLAIERADAQVARYRETTPDARINQAFYRGVGEGYESALAVLRGVLADRNGAEPFKGLR